ncbi:MAG TPA: GNAT family N-acetyltransferase [Anaerolineales bacterium]|nr:GNAT family N-acetyltransferase [Anaerolineales bacterium]
MTDVFDDLSADALSRVSAEHYFNSFMCFSVVPAVEVHEGEDMIRLASPGIPNELTNTVLRCHLSPDRADAVIHMTHEYFYDRDVIPSWQICPGGLPADLEERLIKSGLTLSAEQPSMCIDLDKLNEEIITPAGFRMQRVTSAETMIEKHIWLSRLSEERSLGTLIMEMFSAYGFDEESNWQHYIGVLNERPVSCVSVFYSAGVAGIYVLVTLPEARRQGIGSAMTLRALLDARERGYRVGVLQSTEMGYNVYRKLGFETCFKIKTYAPPESEK